jgi:hypothetical protein
MAPEKDDAFPNINMGVWEVLTDNSHPVPLTGVSHQVD